MNNAISPALVNAMMVLIISYISVIVYIDVSVDYTCVISSIILIKQVSKNLIFADSFAKILQIHFM